VSEANAGGGNGANKTASGNEDARLPRPQELPDRRRPKRKNCARNANRLATPTAKRGGCMSADTLFVIRGAVRIRCSAWHMFLPRVPEGDLISWNPCLDCIVPS